MSNLPSTLIAVDVHYSSATATAAAVLFPSWPSASESSHHIIHLNQIAPYQPGSFYLRELPCLEKLMSEIRQPIETIVIDGYVTLGTDQRPGLGMHLWHSLAETIPIIGVAKTFFEGTPAEAHLLRGTSTKPLFISSIGIPLHEAKQHIAAMHGPHRLPTLLKRVDYLCRHSAA